MYTTSFRLVKLMYRPLLGFRQSVHNFVVGVQTCLFDHDTVYDVDKVHENFQGCAVDVQVATRLLTISILPCCSCPNFPPGPLHFMQCR